MTDTLLRSLWAEPAIADPPGRNWRDGVLVGVGVPAAVLEGVLRTDDIVWRPVAILLAVVAVVSLLWRRSHPFEALAVSFGAISAMSVAAIVTGTDGTVGLGTTALVLVLPYAQFRWGDGRRSALALGLMAVAALTGTIQDYTGVGDAIGGLVILAFPAVLGAEVRHLRSARQRQIADAKRSEREEIARELHDTVAHHVSAIVIQAQAGRTVAGADPDAAVDALVRIEEEAARTLGEMRSIVGSLRRIESASGVASDDGSHHSAERAPQPTLRDIVRLAADEPGQVRVETEVVGSTEHVPPAVGVAVYRIAQEAITNTRRHARHATLCRVTVDVDDDGARLLVHDDGRTPVRVAAAASASGFGLVGMAERAALLGGTLDAGPGPDGGWTVRAEFPLRGESPLRGDDGKGDR